MTCGDSENRAALEKELGWEIQSDIAATDLILERAVQSEPGSWRKARTASRYTDHLFNDILVPLSGDEKSWASLEQAILIAGRENASIHGLHVVDSKEKIQSPSALDIQRNFNQKCTDANVQGSLAIEAGEIQYVIALGSELEVGSDGVVTIKIAMPDSGSNAGTAIAHVVAEMLGFTNRDAIRVASRQKADRTLEPQLHPVEASGRASIEALKRLLEDTGA